MESRRSWFRSGVIAGVAAAIVVVLWFLAIDLLAGEPLRTPAFLAGALFGAETPDFGAGSIALYTVLHLLVFVLLGVLAAWVISHLDVVPPVLLGIALGFLLFDLIFYGSIIATGVDVIRSLGWPALLAGNLIAGIVLMVALTMMNVSRPVSWSEALESWGAIREGVIAGLIGAVVVAVWFLIIDLAQGRPFFTPAAIGSAVIGGARAASDVDVSALTVLTYTILHFVAFIATGLVAAAVLRAAERSSNVVLIGGVLLFFVFEAFSIGLLAILASWLFEALSWWSIAAANLIAALAMGVYLARRHAGLLSDFRNVNAEEELENPPLPAR